VGADNVGLIHIHELQLGTALNLHDSDGDGHSDYLGLPEKVYDLLEAVALDYLGPIQDLSPHRNEQ